MDLYFNDSSGSDWSSTASTTGTPSERGTLQSHLPSVTRASPITEAGDRGKAAGAAAAAVDPSGIAAESGAKASRETSRETRLMSHMRSQP